MLKIIKLKLGVRVFPNNGDFELFIKFVYMQSNVEINRDLRQFAA